MANYDIVKTLRLPVWAASYTEEDSCNTVYSSSGTGINRTFKLRKLPLCTVSVPIYEYSGSISDFDTSAVDLSALAISLATVINTLPSEEIESMCAASSPEVILWMFPNYTEYTDSYIGGTGISYSLANVDSVPFDFINPLGNGGVLYGSQACIIYGPSSGIYAFLMYNPSSLPSTKIALPVTSSLLSSFPITDLVDYTGEVKYPDKVPGQISEPYEPGGISNPGGGNGTFAPGQSDDVSSGIPPGSDIGNDSSTGMYTRYLMNESYLSLLGEWVYDPSLGLSLIISALEGIYGSASEAMISLLSFPFNLSAPLTGISTTPKPLYFGHQPTGASYLALTSGSAQIDWGTVNLSEHWGNFLDYSPHTKIELYLPWGTGFVPIDPGQVLPGSIRVLTNIEFARGSCIHNVVNGDGCVIGTYAGQPGSMVPLLSSDIAAKRAGLVIGAVSLAVGGAVAGMSGSVASAAGTEAAQNAAMASYSVPLERIGLLSKSGKPLHGAALASRQARLQRLSMSGTEMISNTAGIAASEATATKMVAGSKLAKRIASSSAQASLRTPPSISRNGGFADASAGMMIQYPYLIISRPEQNVPSGYGNHYGYPSNMYELLGNLKGYTEIADIHLNNIPATETEIIELYNILQEGVIF